GTVPGPPRRRAGPRPARRAEGPGGDGEVRAARGGPAGADGDRLRSAEAPVPGAARGPGARRAAVRAGARDPARPRPGLAALLRPGEARGAAGRPARAGRRRPHRAGPRPDDPPECLLPAPALLPMSSWGHCFPPEAKSLQGPPNRPQASPRNGTATP